MNEKTDLKKWEDEKKFQAQLEEYRQTRAEILELLKRRTFHYTIIFGAYAVALPIALVKTDFYFLLLIVNILVLIVWWTDLERIKLVHRLTTYIKVALEKELKGLTFEGRYETFRQKKSSKWYHESTNIGAFILVVLSTLTTWWMYWSPLNTNRSTLGFWLLVFGSALMIGGLVSMIVKIVQVKDYRKETTKTWSEIVIKGNRDLSR